MTVDLAAITAEVRNGFIPAHIYNDPAVFELERERLFASSWCFLAHTSEIPEPGDFVDLDMDSVAVDRQMRLRGLVSDVLANLEGEAGGPLTAEFVGGELHLSRDDEVRYVASLMPGGRLVLTDRRHADRL